MPARSSTATSSSCCVPVESRRWAGGIAGVGGYPCSAPITRARGQAARSRLPETMRACVSGNELIDWGYEDDVAVAAELNRDDVAPRLRDGAYLAHHSRSGP